MGYLELFSDGRKKRLTEIYELQKKLDEERRFYEDIDKEESNARIKDIQRTFVGKCFKGYCGDIRRDINGQEEWLLIALFTGIIPREGKTNLPGRSDMIGLIKLQQ